MNAVPWCQQCCYYYSYRCCCAVCCRCFCSNRFIRKSVFQWHTNLQSRYENHFEGSKARLFAMLRLIRWEQKRGVVLMAASTQSISWDFICAMLPSSMALGLEPYPLQIKRKDLRTCQEILKPFAQN
uniref:Uncharacterized protein n=1 Tax=Glossina pallidipes TaxID=7398 RepID=A0A1A9ZVM6_GLOPL